VLTKKRISGKVAMCDAFANANALLKGETEFAPRLKQTEEYELRFFDGQQIDIWPESILEEQLLWTLCMVQPNI
jgi:hypothetical protein